MTRWQGAHAIALHFATIIDQYEQLLLSAIASLHHLASIAEKISVEVEQTTKKDIIKFANDDVDL